MSIENALSELTAAVKANTAILATLNLGGAGAPSATPDAATAAAVEPQPAEVAARPTQPPAKSVKAAAAPSPAAAKPAAAKTAPAKAAPAPAPVDDLDAPTLDDVRAALYFVRENVSREKALEIRNATGATSIDGIPPAKFASVLAACEASAKASK